MSTKTQAPATVAATAAKKKERTVVFGDELERGNFLITPKALILIKAFDDPIAKKLRARHIHLLLVLAAKKYKKKMIRYFWARLADDLGVGIDAARKTAYELRDWKLIRITHFTGKTKLKAPTPKPGAKTIANVGRRNDANGFDITPLIDLITRAKAARKAARDAAKASYAEGVDK